MNNKLDGFDNLDRAGRATGAIARDPREAVYLALGAGIALSWILLAAMALRGAELRAPGTGAPGDFLLRMLPDLPLPGFLDRFFLLCLTPAPLGSFALEAFFALTLMWLLMSVAMMLPSAAPMIRTYCEIADTARLKGELVVHPLALVGGYLSVWLAASVLFAGLSLALQVAATAQPGAPLAGLAGGIALGIAGLYQFSSLKQACLKKCRNPFSILFARWSDRPSRIFKLGLEQGVWCLGCCWALMLVMFAVGIMNLFWMALIALFTLVEKQGTKRLPTRLAGAILLVWAVVLLVSSA
ncbi:DUF2182 domain-containing protein [Pseudaminobacter soli (ex Li et al. 2025)]|uniref:Metal-binding protein n=1 Tax=Pseudaminobacter soli (ex Li et al. 2025) TaxID=1295366 RepID=A0A2P7SNU2_9HYPH|nr:DUF2182 domain-containing protein [Mesorhizobium soli]PSJ64160.1 hypothetical protein C7I85_03390 [Mesorhizobium soli]